MVVQPEAGIVRADKALAAFAQRLDVREDSRVRPDELDVDAVVVTAGPWVNELLDEPLPVKVTRETLAYFRPEEGGQSRPSSRSSPAGTRQDVLAARPGVRSRSARTTPGQKPMPMSRAIPNPS